MLRKFQDAGLMLPTLLAVIGVAVLLALGTWQMQRKVWKDTIKLDIATRSTAEALELTTPEHIEEWLRRDGGEYTKVQLTGTFEHDKERYFYTPHKTLGPGYHVYTPLKITPDAVVWVNRGYVPERLKSPDERTDGQLTGNVTITGLVRTPPERDAFSPDNDLQKNVWYWRDLKGMHDSAFDKKNVRIYPFFLDALAEPKNPGGWPKGGVTRVKLSDRHFEYALTWYGLALTLLGVYVAFAWSRLNARQS